MPLKRSRSRFWPGAFSAAIAVCFASGPGFAALREVPRLPRARRSVAGGRLLAAASQQRTRRQAAIDYATAAEAAAASAPAIGVVVGAAAAGSAVQFSRVLASSSGALADEESFFNSKRWIGRTVAIAITWCLLLGYALLLAPGKGPEASQADQALLGQLLSTPFDGSVSPLFVCIFNMLGIWPAIYAATVLPGADRQSPIPAFPFVAGSFFIGAFSISPYLAVREYRGIKGESGALDWVTENWLESRLSAALLLAGAAYLALYAVGNGSIGSLSLSEAFTGFLPVFMSSLTAHVSCVDFLVLWMLYGPVLLEDGRRRGCFQGQPSAWSGEDTVRFFVGVGIPVFGGISWLLSRPPLPSQKDA